MLKILLALVAVLALLGILWSREVRLETPEASLSRQTEVAGTPRAQQGPLRNAVNEKGMEGAFRTSRSVGEALGALISRAQAGDYNALLAMRRLVVTCQAFRSKGDAAFDEFLTNKSALKDPARQAKVSTTAAYCRDGGSEFAAAQAMLARFGDMEAKAIKNGNAVAVVMGSITRGDMERIAPQASTPEALKKAISSVERDGAPAAKFQVALARLISLGGDDVMKIDTGAIESGVADVNRLHAAAAQLYGCEVGVDCAAGGEIQLSACLVDGICQDMTVQDYIRGHQLSASELAYVEKYLDYLRKPVRP